MIPYLEALAAYSRPILKPLVSFTEIMIQEKKTQNAQIPPLVLPLTLQHGEALAYIIYRHLKELIRKVVEFLRMAGRRRVRPVDERPPFRWLRTEGREENKRRWF